MPIMPHQNARLIGPKHAVTPVARRRFLQVGGAMVAAAYGQARLPGAAAAEDQSSAVPRVDLHVHLDRSTIDQVAALGRQRQVRLGVVEHAGTKENRYPVVLSCDSDLAAWLAQLEGKGVYRGIQAEWTDWMGCFSRQMLGRLDYVLTDAMTFPGKDGQRVKLWEAEAAQRVDFSDPEAFMDRYVAWHIEIIEGQPIDIFANTSWLPAPLAPHYDRLWTPARVRAIARAAARRGVALEISAGYRLPKLPFLRTARQCGVRFSFGTNGRYPHMGRIDYCLEMARELALGPDDVFVPQGAPKAARQG